MEAVIDFGDDERGEDDVLADEPGDSHHHSHLNSTSWNSNNKVLAPIFPKLRRLQEDIKTHLKGFKKGEIIRNGLKVVLIGPPNAGKSSLLNILAKRPAAIVSPIPGTTRYCLP